MGQDGTQGYFFNLQGRTQTGQHAVTVPVTLAEFTVSGLVVMMMMMCVCQRILGAAS